MIKRILNLVKKNKIFSTLGISQIANTLLNALFWFFLASFLLKEEYGELGYFFSIAGLASVAAMLGLDRTLVVFSAKKENIFYPVYFLAIVSSLVSSIVVYVLIQNIFVSVLIFSLTLFALHLANLNSQKKFILLAKTQILRRVLAIVLPLSLYPILGINGIILGAAFGSMLFLKDFYNVFKKMDFSLFALRSKLNFMFSNYFSKLIPTIGTNIDKIIIGTVFGYTTLANFHFAMQYFLLLNFIPTVLTIYLLPFESEGTHKTSVKYFGVLISVALVFLSVILAPFVVNSIFPQFLESLLAMQIMSISLIPIVISQLFEISYMANQKSKLIIISTSIQAGSYLILLLLLSYMDIFGFALAFLISTVLRCIFNLLLHQFLKK